MSIAYDFDPNVSPIYDDDEEPCSCHSVHFSSADTPKTRGVPTNQTLLTSRMSIDFYNNFDEDSHGYHKKCAPKSAESLENSIKSLSGCIPKSVDVLEESEYVHLAISENVPNSRPEGDDESDEVVPESVGFLANTFIVLSAGCCLPIRHHLSKKLIEMGANVQKTVDSYTTHLVVDRYADEKIVEIAMSRNPTPPLMVDVKWIQECLDNRRKCEENDYSMTGLRYLRQTCRRLSTFREPTPLGESEETYWEDMDNDAPLDAAHLLDQIRKLSERIDALLDYAPIIRFEYHSPDCPTRQRPAPPAAPGNPTKLSPAALQRLLTRISTSSTIKRRRSFTGYILEHRDPQNTAIQVKDANNDVRDTWNFEFSEKNSKINRKGEKKAPQKAVKSTHKTVPAELTVIRETLAKNANRLKTQKSGKHLKNSNQAAPKLVPIDVDDSDIQSALASLTIGVDGAKIDQENRGISGNFSRNGNKSMHVLVPTRSNVINWLQKRTNEEDDFISDVSAFLQQKSLLRHTKIPGEIEKREVVFTGFSKDSAIERKLKSIVRRFNLTVATEIDEGTTLCIVSRHGKRTLVVMKAICCNVPVVRPQWLEESLEDSQLLPSEDYIYPQWLRIKNFKVFQHFNWIMWIAPDCTPASENLRWMVLKCGGKITQHFHHAELVIAPENWEIPDEYQVEFDLATPLFIIDSISMAELQNFKNYPVDL